MTPDAAKREVVRTIRWLGARGLYTGTSGNVSLRVRETIFITPTGLRCEDVGPTQIVAMGFDGEASGQLLPSSEWRIHRDVYRARPEICAVVHTHSTFATALSCLRRDIPPFHYVIARAGGASIRCARYATYGTEALSRNALRALAGRRACLLANHGLVTLGADLAAARELAEEVEGMCRQLAAVRSMGSPVLLSRTEMARVGEKLAGYGQRTGGGATKARKMERRGRR